MVYPVNTQFDVIAAVWVINSVSVLALMRCGLSSVWSMWTIQADCDWRAFGWQTVLNIWAYEIRLGFIIAVIPLLFGGGAARAGPGGHANLTVIWYLFPIVKIVFLLLLNLESRQFYGSDLTYIKRFVGSQQTSAWFHRLLRGHNRKRVSPDLSGTAGREALSASEPEAPGLCPTMVAHDVAHQRGNCSLFSAQRKREAVPAKSANFSVGLLGGDVVHSSGYRWAS